MKEANKINLQIFDELNARKLFEADNINFLGDELKYLKWSSAFYNARAVDDENFTNK